MNSKVSVKTGRYGRLTVLGLAYVKNNRSFWNCECDCGKQIVCRNDKLKENSSCGCLKSENLKKSKTTHGETKTKLYSEWRGIKARCFRENAKGYKNYGGRGITMCDEWKDDFVAYKEYVSKLPHYGEKGYTLDRVDNNGNYEPNNVRWANYSEQHNNKRVNTLLTFNGKTQSVALWGKELNINPNTLRNRINMGWSVEDVLTKPVEVHNRRRGRI